MGTGRWHCRVAEVGALLGTGGGTAGPRVSGGVVGALLGGTCGCHCWAPIIRALIISA
ncbi:unnamed protein product [Staurois parvus]|uniref:Uncharacterized protein n=1 Tax=Staurois parvus TaxID=386267 RepID=A0ABN9C0M1_9NEOB|nr:unnamed protein product [Staurois parvus]